METENNGNNWDKRMMKFIKKTTDGRSANEEHNIWFSYFTKALSNFALSNKLVFPI